MDSPLEEQSSAWSQAVGATGIPKIKLKRAPVACNRCRRLRSKCNHKGAKPPCESCDAAGPKVAAECIFFPRGHGGNDRNVRQRGQRHKTREPSTQQLVTSQDEQVSRDPEHLSLGATIPPSGISTVTPESFEDLLPTHVEVVEGCRTFITSYYQIGFIPKALFLERLNKPPRIKDRFFFYSILSVSARFTPSLVRRYGSGLRATELFIDLATQYGMEEIFKPTIEHIQAFYLLGLAEWGSGDRNRSAPKLSKIHMGIAIKMATILQLHREETFFLPSSASYDAIIEAEVARRTFWVIQGQENLHSGYNIPKSFCPEDITALLPCDEEEFAFGTIAVGRAALDGTPPADKDPSLINIPTKSLSAALIQIQNLWGRVARGAYHIDEEIYENPWDTGSYYSQLSKALQIWGDSLAPKHRWSIWNFRGYKTEGLHLGYLSLVMVFRLCNIVLRRLYLKNIIDSIIQSAGASTAPPRYWETVAEELFINVFELHEQITTFITTRSQEEGFPREIVFCVYICGSLAAYLWKWPQLYPPFAENAEPVLQQSLDVLKQLHYDWPMAKHWENALSAMTSAQSGMASSPQTTFASWENRPETDDGVGRNGENEQLGLGREDDMRRTAITVPDPVILGDSLQPNTQDMQRVEVGTENLDLSMLSANNMGFYQFDSFESDLLIAFANGDAQFGLPDMRMMPGDRMRRPGM